VYPAAVNPAALAYAQNHLFPLVSITRVESTVSSLSDLFTRYYKTQTGIDASSWLASAFTNASISNNRLVAVSQIVHPQFAAWQRSVIATLSGSTSDIVILGCHLDSVTWPLYNSRSPGADDDASGCACVLEAFTVLLEAGYRPLKNVQFQLYAAEEVGLLGSEDIAAAFAQEGAPVYSMMQLDMTGFPDHGGPKTIGVTTDGTSAPLNGFLEKLIVSYTSASPVNVTCGYGCSDFDSWTQNGYPSCFPQESGSYKPIHTKNDLLINLSPSYMTEFVKLALGYIIELAGIQGVE
ncbi:MAG: M20/M25/M40 family metallo-hydrolase, partial [archaeon]|nr:M20/M25/M40 family metallo-hydrolase [archaeon]